MAHMSFSRFQTNFVTTNEDVVVEVRPDVSPVVESTAAHSDPDIAHAAWALQPSKFPNLCFSAQFIVGIILAKVALDMLSERDGGLPDAVTSSPSAQEPAARSSQRREALRQGSSISI